MSGARAFASIYVEAKALAIMSPLVVMAALLTLFSRSGEGVAAAEEAGGGDGARADPAGRVGTAMLVLGVIVAAAYAASTFLALRATPIGFDQRANELQTLGGLTQDRTVAFLGVDRFAGYWLRGTLMRSPGGYVPADIEARPSKVWQQGLAMDFDTLSAGRLDEFRYVITTRAGYQSTAPPNFKPVVRTDSYVLWRRDGPTPDLGIIEPDGSPGATLDCSTAEGRRVLSRGRTAISAASPGGHGHQGLEQAVAVRRAGDGRPETRARPWALEPLAPVPQPGPADGLRRGPPGRAATLARRHVPHSPGPGRLLADRQLRAPRSRAR